MRVAPFLFLTLTALLSSSDARVQVGRIFSDGFVLQDHATYDQVRKETKGSKAIVIKALTRR